MGAEICSRIPGGPTGLLIKVSKGKGRSRSGYKLDTAILPQLLECQKQAAQEMGHWGEQPEPPADERLNCIAVKVVNRPPDKPLSLSPRPRLNALPSAADSLDAE